MRTSEYDADEYVRGKGKEGKPSGWRKFTREVGTLSRMTRAVAKGEYDLSTKNLLIALGTLGYVVSPIDAIPDVIVGLGFTDDMAVVAGTVAVLAYELAAFREWEKEHGRR